MKYYELLNKKQKIKKKTYSFIIFIFFIPYIHSIFNSYTLYTLFNCMKKGPSFNFKKKWTFYGLYLVKLNTLFNRSKKCTFMTFI